MHTKTMTFPRSCTTDLQKKIVSETSLPLKSKATNFWVNNSSLEKTCTTFMMWNNHSA